MTEKFLVSTIIKFTDGEFFFPTPIVCSDLAHAKEVMGAIFSVPDNTDLEREQVDVYIDSLPTLRRVEHKSWRKGRE